MNALRFTFEYEIVGLVPCALCLVQRMLRLTKLTPKRKYHHCHHIVRCHSIQKGINKFTDAYTIPIHTLKRKKSPHKDEISLVKVENIVFKTCFYLSFVRLLWSTESEIWAHQMDLLLILWPKYAIFYLPCLSKGFQKNSISNASSL